MICTYWGHNRVTNCFCGIAQINVSYCILHALGNIRLTSYFCGIARIGAVYYVLQTLGQSQTVLLLWDGPKLCFLYCFNAFRQDQTNALPLWERLISCLYCVFICVGATWGSRNAFVASPRFMSSIVFHTHWGNIRLTSCFCGIARIDCLFNVLHALGQYQTNVLLPWDRPKSCFLLCFTIIEAISD